MSRKSRAESQQSQEQLPKRDSGDRDARRGMPDHYQTIILRVLASASRGLTPKQLAKAVRAELDSDDVATLEPLVDSLIDYGMVELRADNRLVLTKDGAEVKPLVTTS